MEQSMQMCSALAKGIKEALENGRMTINEARGLVGLEPLDSEDANRLTKKV